VPFGLPELDEMLEGGLMPHRPYLIVGPAGTGKTTLALQFLCEGVRRGEPSLYVTLEDPPNEVRWNHRALRPVLDSVDVFDAIPDVMRYERAPFKDISAVRQVEPFAAIPDTIRRTPEFTSVEVTGTALEQMLRSEVQRHGYSRLVIDSLTALQYFCMKGFDPTVGAQTFLRFLTDLRATTLLTIEAPLEDVETPERMLARGEIRLFRWELEGITVRAVGVEKFRGSSHDVRLHPYRIGSRGLDIQLSQTISRDTRRIVEPAVSLALRAEVPPLPSVAAPGPTLPTPVMVAASEPLSQQIRDLLTVHVDVAPLRSEVEAALRAVRSSAKDEVASRLARLSAMVIALTPTKPTASSSGNAVGDPEMAAFRRLSATADRSRGGEPPREVPHGELLARELGSILGMIPEPERAAAAPLPPQPPSEVPPLTREPALPPPPAPASAEGPAPGAAGAAPGPAASRSASGRRPRPARVAPLPEPPPLPMVAQMLAPPGMLPLTDSDRAGTKPAPGVPEGPHAPTSSPPPRRRKRATPSKGPKTRPAAEATAPIGAQGAPAPLPSRTRRRPVRRKKAPPVLTAAAEQPPVEAQPASAAAPPPEAAEPPSPTEGTQEQP